MSNLVSDEPVPSWFPTEDSIKKTNLAHVMRELHFNEYGLFHAWSVKNYAEFWQLVLNKLQIVFDKTFTKLVDLSEGVEKPNWFVNAKINIINSCLQAPRDKTALLYQAENETKIKKITYGELDKLSNQVANALAKDFKPGDTIGICMPMTPECIAIYLGIIKAGCAVISIADSFSPEEIAARLRIAKGKAIFTQDIILRGSKPIDLYERVKQATPLKTIVFQRLVDNHPQLRSQDILLQNFLSDLTEFKAHSANPMDTINILFSSGTTGDPKAIPWNHTTVIKAASDAFFHQDVHPQDIVAWPTNIGWMMGPWLIFAALLNQASIAIYEGAPLGKVFGEFVQNAQVSILGLVPSLVKAWRNTQCMENLNWDAIKCFSSTGECSNVDDMQYLMNLAGNKPVIEYCGGTEIGGGYVTGTLIQPAAPAAFTTPALGLDFVILNENGQPTNVGEVALIPPSLGLSTTLLNKDHFETYYADMPKKLDGIVLRRHGDQIEKYPNGYYRVQGRVDDTMNLGGIKISSAEIERALVGIPNILETAAIAVNPPGGGPSQLVIFAVRQNPSYEENNLTEMKQQMQKNINVNLNPLFKISDVVIVDNLPRTASNKVMRRKLREQYLGK